MKIETLSRELILDVLIRPVPVTLRAPYRVSTGVEWGVDAFTGIRYTT